MAQRNLSYDHSTKRALKDALQKRVRFMSMQYVQSPQLLTVRSLLVVVGLVALLFGVRKGIQNLCAGLSLTAVLNIYIGLLIKSQKLLQQVHARVI